MTTLKDVCKSIIGGGTPSTKNPEFWKGRIPWVSSADVYGPKDVRPRRNISEKAVEKSAANILPKGGLIVVTRVGLGKIAVAPFDMAFSQDSQGLILDEKQVIGSYALHYLSKAVKYLKYQSQGTTISGVTKKQVKELVVPLPPVEEQKLIVRKIEELLSEIDAGVENLKKAQAQLKTYRQSVLRYAFDGEHEEASLKSACERIQIGPFGTQLHRHDYIEDGIPLINPMHIQDGRIGANRSYTITEAKRDTLKNYVLEEGDVILGRRGEMGRSGLVTKREVGWLCGSGSLYLRPIKNLVFSPFLYYFLQSQTARKYLEENAGGTTMANLNLTIVGGMRIPLPSVPQQRIIIAEIESRLSVCEKLEQSIEAGLKQSEALRQSILKKAFEGRLV